MSVPEPVFEAPWHAQVFALTVHLNETGQLDWADWAQMFGATLAREGLARELNGGDDYFGAWLTSLEAVLAARGMAAAGEVAAARDAWEAAFIHTPHGAPVTLDDAPD